MYHGYSSFTYNRGFCSGIEGEFGSIFFLNFGMLFFFKWQFQKHIKEFISYLVST